MTRMGRGRAVAAALSIISKDGVMQTEVLGRDCIVGYLVGWRRAIGAFGRSPTPLSAFTLGLAKEQGRGLLAPAINVDGTPLFTKGCGTSSVKPIIRS